MECKWVRQAVVNQANGVLIETYWNVNSTDDLNNVFRRSVLIETYWNVNTVPVAQVTGADPGLNRNILECKLPNTLFTALTEISLNRNILECKSFVFVFSVGEII